MAIPDLEHVVHQVRASQAWDFSTKAGLCAYSNAVVFALHQTDPNFVHLRKSAGQNHCDDPIGRHCAVDATLYIPTGQAVDFIINAGPGSPNDVSWGTHDPVGKYGPEDGFIPVPNGTPTPPPPTPPPPVDLESRVASLEAQAVQFRQLAIEISNQIGAINQLIADIHRDFVAKPLPEYVGRAPLFGGTVVSRPR